jgi:hypothetical protein
MIEMWDRRAELEILLPTMSVFVRTHPMWEGRVPQVLEWGTICRDNLACRMEWLDRELGGGSIWRATVTPLPTSSRSVGSSWVKPLSNCRCLMNSKI